jgi:hypothetical protein
MNYITTKIYSDGFGSQYQNIISYYIYSKYNNLIFHYRPFDKMEHNYDNDKQFINKKEELINLKDNLINYDPNNYNYNIKDGLCVYNYINKNINEYYQSEHMEFIKDCFWRNKDKIYFKNDKINVAVHIRRPNKDDNRIDGANTNNIYYLNIINIIRNIYKTNLLFHIYSQGNITNFDKFINNDVILHIDTDIENTFIGLVAADILVTSRSSFSYVAALLSNGIIYYNPFWHPPLNKWIICT